MIEYLKRHLQQGDNLYYFLAGITVILIAGLIAGIRYDYNNPKDDNDDLPPNYGI